MKRLLAGLLLSAVLVSPAFAALKPGDTAPDFNIKAAQGGKEFNFSLKDQLKKGPVVLYFFPAAFTAGCTIEAHLFAEATDDFKKHGATIIGVTAGNIDRVNEFSKVECRDKFAVAADPGAQVAKKFDAVSTGNPERSSRTSYVIGKNGKILESYTANDPTKHVEMTMNAVMAAMPKAKG